MKTYYLDKSGEVKGPFSSEEMTVLHRSGQVSATTQVCEEGTEDWMPYYQRKSFEPITKKKFNFGDSRPKVDHSKHEEIESEPTETTEKKSYSLQITMDEPIFHRFCRRIGWVAVIGACLSLAGWAAFASDDEYDSSYFLPWFSDLAWLAFILFGSGQIIKFFHSIAFNTQEIRKVKGDE